MSKNNLLPCPFCGGKMELHEHKLMGWTVAHKNNECKLYTEPVATEQEAIESWNTRIAQSERQMELEKLAHDLLRWSGAYPTSIFPDPTPEQIDEVCRMLGFSIDRISAMVLRQFSQIWGDRARASLGIKEEINHE